MVKEFKQTKDFIVNNEMVNRFKAPMNPFWSWVRNVMALLCLISLIGMRLSFTPDWLMEIFDALVWVSGSSALTAQFTRK